MIKEDGDKMMFIMVDEDGEEEMNDVVFDGDDKFMLIFEGLEEVLIKLFVFRCVVD